MGLYIKELSSMIASYQQQLPIPKELGIKKVRCNQYRPITTHSNYVLQGLPSTALTTLLVEHRDEFQACEVVALVSLDAFMKQIVSQNEINWLGSRNNKLVSI
jgi:hypothetical protein